MFIVALGDQEPLLYSQLLWTLINSYISNESKDSSYS